MNILIGGGMLFGGTALGVAGLAFVEAQGEKSQANMSEETKSRMAGKFMEDEEFVNNYDDTIAKMEAALAAAEGREVVKDDADTLTEEEKEELRVSDWGESIDEAKDGANADGFNW